MKKLILTLVFVFAMGVFYMVEASILEINLTDCASQAWEEADQLNQDYIDNGGSGFSDWDMWDLTDYYYEQCMEE